jgi:hypothetical protein
MVGMEALRVLLNGLDGRPRFYEDKDWVMGGEESLSAVIRTTTISSLTIDQFSELLKPKLKELADTIKAMGDKFIVGVPFVPGGIAEGGICRDQLSGLVIRYMHSYDIQGDDFVFRVTVLCRAFEWK